MNQAKCYTLDLDGFTCRLFIFLRWLRFYIFIQSRELAIIWPIWMFGLKPNCFQWSRWKRCKVVASSPRLSLLSQDGFRGSGQSVRILPFRLQKKSLLSFFFYIVWTFKQVYNGLTGHPPVIALDTFLLLLFPFVTAHAAEKIKGSQCKEWTHKKKRSSDWLIDRI